MRNRASVLLRYEIVKALYLIGLLSALTACNEPDYSKPHEYLRAIGYGEGWIGTEDNNFKLHLLSIKTYFELGAGKCEKNLGKLDAERVYANMAATNSLIHSEYEGRHDILIKYAKLQCIAYYGRNQVCEDKLVEISMKIEDKFSRRDATTFLLSNFNSCEIEKGIGTVRTFSLDNSVRYRYVPK